MLIFYLLKYYGLSKKWALFISMSITITSCFVHSKVWASERDKYVNLYNYSMLGIVHSIQGCRGYRTDYYNAKTNYLTTVEGWTFHDFHIPWYDYGTKVQINVGDTILFRKMFNEYGCKIISWHPSRDTLELFQKPIKYVDGEEIGNDYYYYAKLRADNSLKHFGLNVAFKGLYGKDTILFYRNLNPGIDSVAHRLADTLQTAFNRALVGDSFAFLFHDGIYSKEQVFEEIQQAKEYYLKYCKDEDTSSVNILRNH